MANNLLEIDYKFPLKLDFPVMAKGSSSGIPTKEFLEASAEAIHIFGTNSTFKMTKQKLKLMISFRFPERQTLFSDQNGSDWKHSKSPDKVHL